MEEGMTSKTEVETSKLPPETKENEEIKTRCLRYIQQCQSNMEQLQLEREAILKSYQREKYGNEVKGRSQFVMSDVYDTVESIMPALMRVFYGGQDVVNVNPVGPEDELKAKLMEQKVNNDFQKRINGFQVLYDFFKDALMFKTGVVKWRWQEEYRIDVVNYERLTESELDMIRAMPDLELIDINVESVQETMNGEATAHSFYTVKAHKKTDISGPIVENLRSDEFLFLPTTRKVADADFMCHRKVINKKEAARYGLDPEDIDGEIADPSIDPLYQQMWEDLGGVNFITPDDNKNGEHVWLYECYFNDYDDNGNKVPKICTIIGNRIVQLDDNPYGKPPFAVISPIRAQHRMAGLSIAELVVDVQKLRSTLMRYTLDNIYYQNNGVNIINPYRIDAEMLRTNNVPGGLVYTRGDWEPTGHIYPVPIKPMPPWVVNIMEYLDNNIKENRTGITKYNQGLDSKSLNRTASGISQIMSAAQQRMELIARIFAEAEDGVKAIFQALVDMNLKFFNRSISIRINDKWQQINPADISGDYDIIIDIGGGIGTKEMKVNQLMQMLDKYALINRTFPNIVGPSQVYNLLTSIWENMGYKNSGMYVADPALNPMPQMPPGMRPPAQGPQNGQPMKPENKRNANMRPMQRPVQGQMLQGGMMGPQMPQAPPLAMPTQPGGN